MSYKNNKNAKWTILIQSSCPYNHRINNNKIFILQWAFILNLILIADEGYWKQTENNNLKCIYESSVSEK